MFVELAGIGFGTVLYGTYRWLNQDKIRINKNFNKLMNMDNPKNKPTFYITDMLETEYGFDLTVKIPIGKSYDELVKMQSVIENALGYRLQMSQGLDINHARIRLFTNFEENNEEEQIKLRFEQTMKGAGGKSRYGELFEITSIKKNELYGYDCKIKIPSGMSYDDLMEYKPAIDSEFGLLHCEYQPFTKELDAKLITKPLPDNYMFHPVHLSRPTQLYLGNTFYYENVVADMSKEPHMLLSGTTNSGKSTALKIPLINLAYCFSEREVEFYFIQLSSKIGDFDDMLKLRHTRYFAYTHQYALKLFNYLTRVIKDRSNFLREKGFKNVHKYNDSVKKEDRLPIMYVVIEEFAELVSSGEKVDRHHNEKMAILDAVEVLASQGRSAGLYLLTSILRPDKDHFPVFVKACLNTRFALLQVNEASSLVVVDTTEATKLKPREGIVKFSGRCFKVKTPFVDEDMVVKTFLKDKINPQHTFIDLG
jgi:S-DNA-T family DNA segregation ATPase FtsK/SpoIIIE